MKRAKILSAVLAGVLLLAGCDRNTETPNDKESSVTNSNNSLLDDDNSDNLNDGNLPSEGVVKSIWDILPEIEETPAEAFEYKYDSSLGGIIVTNYLNENPIRIRIPDEIEGEPVVKIDMAECEAELTEVIMPDTVKEFAFSQKTKKCIKYINYTRDKKAVYCNYYDFLSLEAVYIPNGVTKIGWHDFMNCPSLTNVNIPDSVTSIGESAFNGCTSLTNINIPNSVNEIGQSAFNGCTSLTSITIPNSVTEIDNSALFGCTNLTSVKISDSVTRISGHTFYRCTNLTSITIPDGVTGIGQFAFAECTNLTSVNIPDSVTEIDTGAFNYCENIQATYKGKTYDYAHINDLYAAING